MVERRRRREAGEVGDVVEDQPPVVEVADGAAARPCGSRVGWCGPITVTQAITTISIRNSAGSRRRARASQKDFSLIPPLVDLVEQDVGDQVAAEGEEDADAEQPASAQPN